MPRPICYRCESPIERDDIDIAQCRTCGELFCGEECRDDHVVAIHRPSWLHQEPEPTPEPCTSAARAAGCSCRMSTVNSATIDPPEPITDINCPVHGKYRPGGVDPDDERDARLEDRSFASWLDRQVLR